MQSHLIQTERAARDAFLTADYFGPSGETTNNIDRLFNALTFFVMTAALCSAGIAVVMLLA